MEKNVEGKDENGAHAPAGRLCREAELRVTAKNLEKKDIKGHHLNLLERRHKVAGGALCHVDVAGEQGVGEAREQPADEVLVHVGWQPVELEQAAV